MLDPVASGSLGEGDMAWTWDRYRDWHHDERTKPQAADPLKHFVTTVDVMFYAAAVAFAIAIVALLVGW